MCNNTEQERKVWFTSDLHFHHKNILKFCQNHRSQFASLQDMEERLVQLWNANVGENDIVYNLGDFSFAKDKEQIKNVLQRLNGEHHLIFGNHDNVIQNHLGEFLKTRKNDHQNLLTSTQHYKELFIANEETGEKVRFCLFHYPMLEWNQCHRGAIHLYGHIHENISDCEEWGFKALNVGYDRLGNLFSSKQIFELMKDRENKVHQPK